MPDDYFVKLLNKLAIGDQVVVKKLFTSFTMSWPYTTLQIILHLGRMDFVKGPLREKWCPVSPERKAVKYNQ